MAVQATNLQFDYSKYGFRDAENYVYKSGKGLNEGVVRELSGMKGEPEWMLKRRLQALEIFNKKPVPLVGMWANDKLAELDYDSIHYFVRAGDKPQTDWDAVPAEIKNDLEFVLVSKMDQLLDAALEEKLQPKPESTTSPTPN